jgi:hypothetical protein
MSFEVIWQRIMAFSGSVFHTEAQDSEFFYRTSLNQLIVGKNSNPTIAKEDIKSIFNSLRQTPELRPSDINQTVTGASYILAILRDQRIGASIIEFER